MGARVVAIQQGASAPQVDAALRPLVDFAQFLRDRPQPMPGTPFEVQWAAGQLQQGIPVQVRAGGVVMEILPPTSESTDLGAVRRGHSTTRGRRSAPARRTTRGRRQSARGRTSGRGGRRGRGGVAPQPYTPQPAPAPQPAPQALGPALAVTPGLFRPQLTAQAAALLQQQNAARQAAAQRFAPPGFGPMGPTPATQAPVVPPPTPAVQPPVIWPVAAGGYAVPPVAAGGYVPSLPQGFQPGGGVGAESPWSPPLPADEAGDLLDEGGEDDEDLLAAEETDESADALSGAFGEEEFDLDPTGIYG